MIGRLLLFPFSTGVYNAFAWFFGYVLFLAGFYLFLDYGPNIGGISPVLDQSFVEQVLKSCVPFAILVFDYALTAFLLWKLVLHRYTSREWLAFGILGISIGFYVVVILMETFDFVSYDFIQSLVSACFFLPVILGGMSDGLTLIYQTLLGVMWGVFLCVIMGLLWRNAFRRFTPYQGEELSPPEPEKTVSETMAAEKTAANF